MELLALGQPKNHDEVLKLLALNFKEVILDHIPDDDEVVLFLLGAAAGACSSEGNSWGMQLLDRAALRVIEAGEARAPWWRKVLRRWRRW